MVLSMRYDHWKFVNFMDYLYHLGNNCQTEDMKRVWGAETRVWP
jgi:hypothetical protein